MTDANKVKALAAKEKGNAAYKDKRFEEAIKFYDEAISLDPTDMTFLLNKAAVRIEQKDFDQCIKDCEKAVEVGRENRADFKVIAKAYARMALAFHRQDDLENAKKYYEKSLTEHRTPETRAKLSDVEKAIKDKERKAYVNPEISLEEKTKGNECFSKGDYPGAIQHYTEAIKRNPEDAKLYSNRAACYQKLAEFKLALQDCEDCIKLDPTFVKGHVRKGMALYALKEFTKASSAFQKALEIDSNCQEAVEGYRKCTMASMSNPEEVRARAMSDPEVQKILGDPAMRLILEQMQNDPKALQDHLRNPEVAAKIEKLIEAGLIGIR